MFGGAAFALFLFRMVSMDTTATIPTGAAAAWRHCSLCGLRRLVLLYQRDGRVLAVAITSTIITSAAGFHLRFLCGDLRPTRTEIMIIALKPGIARRQESAILKEIRKRNYKPHVMRGVGRELRRGTRIED